MAGMLRCQGGSGSGEATGPSLISLTLHEERLRGVKSWEAAMSVVRSAFRLGILGCCLARTGSHAVAWSEQDQKSSKLHTLVMESGYKSL
jgi:hypothetical protein